MGEHLNYLAITIVFIILIDLCHNYFVTSNINYAVLTPSLMGLSVTLTCLGHYVFFSVLDERAHWIQAAQYHKKEHVFFSAQRAHYIVAAFRKKQSISGDKKNIPKKTISFREIKNIFQAMFFFSCFFSSPSLTFFKIGL